MDEAYPPLIDGLREHSVENYFQGTDQLVVSRQPGPAWPFAGNSYWVTRQQRQWYLCTWTPVCYRVPAEADLVALCVEFVGCGVRAQPRLPADLVEHYGLEELAESEAESLLG